MAKRVNTFLSMLYAHYQPHVDREEYLFYHRLIAGALRDGGRALELFCGSGRLLLPFTKEGFCVHGIESSIELCKLAKEKGSEAGLQVSVQQARLQDCEIRGKYRFIYATLGAFQMLEDRKEAERLLARAYGALEDGGVISIALLLPPFDEPFATGNWVIAHDYKDKTNKNRYVRREQSFHDPVEQVIAGKIRYEIWLGRDLLELDEKSLKVRWYGNYEFISLLKEVGFKKVEMYRSFREELGVEKSPVMIFVATR